MIKVSEINIYPVKSLGRISMEQITVQRQGLGNDRCFMLVDSKNKLITQRTHPSLALIKVTQKGDGFLIQAPEKPNLELSKKSLTEKKGLVSIWKDTCSAHYVDKQTNTWFSNYLGLDVSLVSYDHSKPRKTDQLYSSNNDIVSFADSFPILVISKASLNDLNSKLKDKVTMQRFRPNLVVDGCDAFEEDQWRNIKIGDVEFEAVKICSRCILTTIDPKTGIKDKNGEPLKTLVQYRRNINGVKGEKGVFFGMNLIPRSIGIIKLGDSISVNYK
jgi:uncharacterized protein YcbX